MVHLVGVIKEVFDLQLLFDNRTVSGNAWIHIPVLSSPYSYLWELLQDGTDKNIIRAVELQHALNMSCQF